MPTARPIPPLAAAVVGMLFLAAACGLDGSRPPTFPPVSAAPGASGPAATVGPSASPGPTDSVEEPSTPDAGDGPDLTAASVALEPVVGGIDSPVLVTAPSDGTGRLFVAGQGGRIDIVRAGQVAPQPFVDLSDRISAGGERGLLGVAFPPGFGPERPQVYVHYSDLNGDTTVSELTVDPSNPDRLDPSSERLILHVDQPYANHNGGWIGFDADGMLLVALGDGGGDPQNRPSDPGVLLGKILRLDVLGAPEGEPYGIPDDNPFVGREGTRPEILHYGLRNPFRASVDLETGDLWIGDVGQSAWEEVDVARGEAKGLDFGWRRWEGRHCYDKGGAECDEAGVTMPVAEYSHADGCSVIGGVVYRGDGIPALRGAYLFGDYCSGKLWAIDAGVEGPQEPVLLLETGGSISSIDIDDAGEVYLTDLWGDAVLRLVPAAP